jgi:TruD family tRNA pseudouridine synthase
MSDSLKQSRDTQRENLAKASENHPELFQRASVLENADFLGQYGIYIPGKVGFPEAFLKFSSQEFIVEEVAKDGTVYSICTPNTVTMPEGSGTTAFATLVKCSISTIEAAQLIAESLRVPIEKVGYAGIKDKDAITAQRVSFPWTGTVPTSPYFFLKDIVLGKGSMQKGDLRGNRFSIFLRTREVPNDRTKQNIRTNLKAIEDNGFYNFYYMQRFGAPRFINFRTAQQILLGNYESAVRFFLTSTAGHELPFIQKIRSEINDMGSDWNKIFEKISSFPGMFAHELRVLSVLRINPQNFVGALRAIPDQIQMWMWGLASRLFNEKLSAYTRAGVFPPHILPLVFSFDREDVATYQEYLKALGIYPLPVENLRPFPNVRLAHRTVETMEKTKVENITFRDEGVYLSFELGNGEYATTFLSHLFNLVGGASPEWLSLDAKPLLIRKDMSETVARFSDIMHHQHERGFQVDNK